MNRFGSLKHFPVLFLVLFFGTACQVQAPSASPETVEFDIKPVVQTGKVFMREDTEQQYQAPPRQIEVVKSELEMLNNQLFALRGDVVEIKKNPLEERMRLALAQTQETVNLQQKKLNDQVLELTTLRQNLQAEKEIERLREKAIEEGRELRLLEEMRLRHMLEEQRRNELMAESRRQQAEIAKEQAQRRADEEKREILKSRIAQLQGELNLLQEEENRRAAEEEQRRINMEERLKASLAEMQSAYEAKVESLKEKNEKDVAEKLAALEERHQAEMKEAEEYRHAIEERIFAMESKGTEKVEDVQVAKLQPGQLPAVNDPDIMIDEPGVGVMGSSNPADWVALGTYEVVVHEENESLRNIVKNALRKAEPFVGPWRIKWRLKKENQDVLTEKFSLDAETTFDAFANYISNFMRSHRGFLLTFNIFESERVLVITDEVSQ